MSNYSIVVLIFLYLLGAISCTSDKKNNQGHAQCVQNCAMSADEYMPELGGSMQSICGLQEVKDHCECYCSELIKIGADMWNGETDIESDQATLKCMDTRLMECLLSI